MPDDTELQRLAAARPVVLDRTWEVVSPAEQDRILRQILADSPGRAIPPRRPSGRRGHQVGASVAAIAAAAVLAVLALTIGTGQHRTGISHRPNPPAMTLDAAIVLARSVKALDRFGDAVEYRHITGSLNGRPYSSDLWIYRAAERQRVTGPGRADTEGWQSVTGRTLSKGYIYYDRRTWTRFSAPAGPGWLAVSRTPTARLEAGFLRSVLASGRWTIAGHRIVNGRKALAIRIIETFPGRPGPAATRPRGRTRPPAAPAGPLIDVAPSLTPAQYARAEARGQTTFTSTGTITTTLYISARTYLPIMETSAIRLTSQGVPGSAATQTQTATFRWLPANPASLARLRPPAIPPGYTKVAPDGQ